MDKKLLLGTLLLSSFFSLNAQTSVWNDDFTDINISDWTTIDADGDGHEWFVVQLENTEGPVGTPIIRSLSWSGESPLTPDNWIISPAINLANASGEIMLNWEAMAIDQDWDEENYTVYIATEGTTAALESSEVIFNEVLSGVNTLTARSLDISAFAGETIYIAFRHHDSSGQFSMEIDNIEITATTLSVDNSQSAMFTVYPNPAADTVTIANAENNLITAVTVTDVNGRVVKSIFFNGVTEAKIDVSGLEDGFYVLNIVTGKSSTAKKILVSK